MCALVMRKRSGWVLRRLFSVVCNECFDCGVCVVFVSVWFADAISLMEW